MRIKKRDSTITLTKFVEDRMLQLKPVKNFITALDEAGELIAKAVSENRTIYIFGDYDVDGICAIVILVKLISSFFEGAHIIWRAPKRISEGYGFNIAIVDEVPTDALLICVDNGIVAVDAIKKAKEKGCQIIILDHHLGREDGVLPEADLIVDPNTISGQVEGSDFTEYCGAGLAFKLAETFTLPEKLMEELTGLAAIATIADCVPLINENFRIASQLQKCLNNPGIAALAMMYEISDINEGDIGFKICPTINAPGRLEDAGAAKAVRHLLGEEDLSKELFALNEQRKEQTDQHFKEIQEKIEDNCLFSGNAICVSSDIPEGLVGIIAGRVAEKYKMPAFIFGKAALKDDKPVLKGSARTFGDNHLKNCLDKAADLLIKYGGHAAAAGLSLYEENFSAFSEKMDEVCTRADDAEDIVYDIDAPNTNVANYIASALANLSPVRPFGEGNPEPLFYIEGLKLYPRGGTTYRTMGKDNEHIKLFGKDFDIVAFGMAEDYLSDPVTTINVVGKVGVNFFGGKTYFQIEAVHIERTTSVSRKTNFKSALEARAKERKIR